MKGYIGRILLKPILKLSNVLTAINEITGSNMKNSFNLFVEDCRYAENANTNNINVGTGVFIKKATI